MSATPSRIRRAFARLLALAAIVGLSAVAMPVSGVPAAGASLYGNYLAGRLAASERDTAAAARFYREALAKDPDNEVILERAFVLEVSAGNMDQAAKLAGRLVDVDTKHALARLVLGVKALRARQYATARKQFDLGKGTGPVAEITAALTTAWALQGAGDMKAALKALDVLKDATWYKIYRAYNAAMIADLSGDAKTAAEQFAEAYRLDPESLRIAEGYARFLARSGKTDKAREVLDAYDKVSMDHPYIVALRAELDAGRVPRASIASTAAGAAEGLHQIGALLAREGGEEQGQVYFQLALYLDPAATLPRLSLADIYERQKNYEHAAAIYKEIAEASPMYPYAVIQRARNLDELDQVDEARALLDGLIAKNPNDVEAVKALGDLLRGREKFAEAAEAYTKAIGLVGEVTEQQWTLHYYRGISYERSKQWPKAEKDLLAALRLVPDQPFVLNYLGYSWIDQGQNLNEAMDMIRKAVELRPDDGYIVDSLGWAHYRLGDFEQAVAELERAVELKPEDPVINDHLGDAYWRAGRRLEARFQWNHALGLKPEPEEQVKIEQKLKAGLPDNPGEKVAAATTGNGATDAVVAPPQEQKAAAPEEGRTGGEPAARPTETPASEPAEKPAGEPAQAPAPEPAREAGPEPRVHEVEPGESLWSIARKYFGAGMAYDRIFGANRDRLRDEDRIYPGQKLIIPDPE